VFFGFTVTGNGTITFETDVLFWGPQKSVDIVIGTPNGETTPNPHCDTCERRSCICMPEGLFVAERCETHNLIKFYTDETAIHSGSVFYRFSTNLPNRAFTAPGGVIVCPVFGVGTLGWVWGYQIEQSYIEGGEGAFLWTSTQNGIPAHTLFLTTSLDGAPQQIEIEGMTVRDCTRPCCVKFVFHESGSLIINSPTWRSFLSPIGENLLTIGERQFSVSAEQLAEAEITPANARLFRVTKDGEMSLQNVIDSSVSSDGSLELIIDYDYSSPYILAEIIRGDILGTGTPSVYDALQILRYLARLDNAIEGNDVARAAALITEPNAQSPTITDALWILRSVVGLPN
jgi:hypothetical protein